MVFGFSEKDLIVMRNLTLNKKLLILCAFSFVLFLSSFFFDRNSSSQKPVKSALLNQKYKDSISKIIIETPAPKEETKEDDSLNEQGAKEDPKKDKIVLSKEGDLFLLYSYGIITQADEKSIQILLENSSRLRNLYKISDSKAAKESFFLTEELASSVTFFINDGTEVSKIFFGIKDSLLSRIYVRSGKNDVCYETEDDLSRFLTASLDYWSEGKIICETENPVSFVWENLNFNDGSDEFYKIKDKMLSFRHGKIMPIDRSNAEILKEKPVSFLTVQGGEGRILNIMFFDFDSSFGESYLYTKNVIPSEFDSLETNKAFSVQNALFEISGWTYESIKNLFEN